MLATTAHCHKLAQVIVHTNTFFIRKKEMYVSGGVWLRRHQPNCIWNRPNLFFPSFFLVSPTDAALGECVSRVRCIIRLYSISLSLCVFCSQHPLPQLPLLFHYPHSAQGIKFIVYYVSEGETFAFVRQALSHEHTTKFRGRNSAYRWILSLARLSGIACRCSETQVNFSIDRVITLNAEIC